MFYSNIIEHDLDESYLKSSLFGIVVKVTPEVIVEVLGTPLVEAPSVSDLEITSELMDRVSIDLWGEVRGQLGSIVHTGSISHPAWVLATFLIFSIYLSSHRAYICKKEPINLASCILEEMTVRGDPSMSKKEVFPYGILITKICQRAGVEFPINSFFLEPMGLIDTSSWNQSQEQIKGALGSKKKVCCSRAKAKLVKVTRIQL
ncbi:hypothetical protein PVL29_009525 [Vitis rotundifolia]|uniref:Putative plant transposon protein domain-containing protein n=1 Tax=Vitis rotundifolia TaxID=103349 RepID=A0AA38ZRI5_VITRO|nr:hypothetical protein PVL29_009525 [Vitis rotundifolia]